MEFTDFDIMESISDAVIECSFVDEIDPIEMQMLQSLAFFHSISIGDVNVKPDLHAKPSIRGLAVFTKYDIVVDGVRNAIVHSVVGLEDASIDNLSVRADRVRPITGAGSRLATEWWEKKDGTDVITLKVNEKCYALYFKSDTWTLAPCTGFLPEGAELVNNVIWLRDGCLSRFSIPREDFDVQVVPHYSFSTVIPPCEGIVMFIDGRMYKLKEVHTIDLVVKHNKAYTREGTLIFSNLRLQDGIHEFTLAGVRLRFRYDKHLPDTAAKVDRLRKLPILRDLRALVYPFTSTTDDYCPSQQIGYDLLSVVDSPYEPKWTFLYFFQEIFTPDRQRDVDSYVPIQPPDKFSLDTYINGKYQALDYSRLRTAIMRMGITYNHMKLRALLVNAGVVQWYSHWNVLRTSKRVINLRELTLSPVFLHSDTKLKLQYTLNPDRTIFRGRNITVFASRFLGYYHPSWESKMLAMGCSTLSKDLSVSYRDLYLLHFENVGLEPDPMKISWICQEILDVCIDPITSDGIVQKLREQSIIIDKDVVLHYLSKLEKVNAIRCYQDYYSIQRHFPFCPYRVVQNQALKKLSPAGRLLVSRTEIAALTYVPYSGDISLLCRDVGNEEYNFTAVENLEPLNSDKVVSLGMAIFHLGEDVMLCSFLTALKPYEHPYRLMCVELDEHNISIKCSWSDGYFVLNKVYKLYTVKFKQQDGTITSHTGSDGPGFPSLLAQIRQSFKA